MRKMIMSVLIMSLCTSLIVGCSTSSKGPEGYLLEAEASRYYLSTTVLNAIILLNVFDDGESTNRTHFAEHYDFLYEKSKEGKGSLFDKTDESWKLAEKSFKAKGKAPSEFKKYDSDLEILYNVTKQIYELKERDEVIADGFVSKISKLKSDFITVYNSLAIEFPYPMVSEMEVLRMGDKGKDIFVVTKDLQNNLEYGLNSVLK